MKNVPGRKTDVQDSAWLAELARCGLLKPSFIPPAELRELRMLARYRRKLVGMRAAEKNRLHKNLDICGIRLGSVISDICGTNGRRMIQALIEGMPPQDIVKLADNRLKASKKDIRLALDGVLSDRHRSLLKRIVDHIDYIERQILEIESQVVAAIEPYKEHWQLLQTIPGFDEVGSALLLIEIGTDMECFGNKSRLSSWAGVCPGNNESAGKKSPVESARAIRM